MMIWDLIQPGAKRVGIELAIIPDGSADGMLRPAEPQEMQASGATTSESAPVPTCNVPDDERDASCQRQVPSQVLTHTGTRGNGEVHLYST